MSSFIPDLHNDLRQARFTARGATHKAEDVPQGLHKAYPRMEHIVLPAPTALDISLIDALEKRRSYHGGSESSLLSLANCGTLLGTALKKHESTKRRNYPSGGGLYPIETYLFSTALEGQQPGVFHYNPTRHMLEKLWNLPNNFIMKDLARNPDDLFFSSLIVFTSVWKRSSAKYGDFAYTVALLEAGHMSENILLMATALGLKSRPLASFDEDLVSEHLDLDMQEEQPVHTIALC